METRLTKGWLPEENQTLQELGKYLTYKEWKLALAAFNSSSVRLSEAIASLARKYLTYKEWRHNTAVCIANRVSGKYLTYKEWKLFSCFPKI